MPSNLRSPLPSPSFSRLARVARCGALCCLLALSGTAAAAALGDARLRSSLGQALDVDIPIASLSATESNSLIVRPAPASAYANADIDYTPLLRSLRVFVEKRGEQMVVRVTSDLPVNDPFIRLLVELGASGSRTIREYTLLVDPPALAAREPGVTASPPVASETPPATTAPASPERAAPAAPASQPNVATPPAQRIVRSGDTLRSIGASLQPEGVRPEQVLVALQDANPDAFIGRNINRLRRGSVLRVPDADTMRAVDPAKALRSIRSQAADFTRYREALARRSTAPAPSATDDRTLPGEGNRSSRAQVGELAEAPAPTVPAQDKLTLSAPGRDEQADSQPGRADAAEQIANDKALADANSRIAALESNISQLQQTLEIRSRDLAQAQQRAEAPAAPTAGAAPPPRPTGLQELAAALDDPLVRAGAAALVLLPLAAWAGLRWRRRRRNEEVGAPVEPVLAATVIGGAGGRHVDTRHSEFHSNFVPSVSQIDANEVDAVAEADVYIAYGRDEQAEEILLDALRTHPQRDALRVKLLEIHAARKDRPKFGALAAELRVRTHGAGSEWERAAQLGRELDPGNRLYEPSAPSGTAASKPADERPYAAPPDAPASSPVEDFSLRLEGMLEERRHDEGRPASPPQETLPAREIDFRLEGFDATTPPSGPSADEAALGTKLELAQACRDIGDREGARELLGEVVRSGHPEFARRAQSLLEQLA